MKILQTALLTSLVGIFAACNQTSASNTAHIDDDNCFHECFVNLKSQSGEKLSIRFEVGREFEGDNEQTMAKNVVNFGPKNGFVKFTGYRISSTAKREDADGPNGSLYVMETTPLGSNGSTKLPLPFHIDFVSSEGKMNTAFEVRFAKKDSNTEIDPVNNTDTFRFDFEKAARAQGRL